jgi:hypothetical protein
MRVAQIIDILHYVVGAQEMRIVFAETARKYDKKHI